jgi:hypothetical protein
MEKECCFSLDGRVENCYLRKIDKNLGRKRCGYLFKDKTKCDYYVPKPFKAELRQKGCPEFFRLNFQL